MNWTKTIGEAAFVVFTGLLFAAAALGLRPTLRTMLTDQPKNFQGTENISEKFIKPVTLAEAQNYFKSGKALFADARSSESYRKGHIQGAMNLDPNAFDSWATPFFDQFPPETLIITYCDGAQCALSTELAEKLVSMGYEKVFILRNGWHLWVDARLPMEQVAD